MSDTILETRGLTVQFGSSKALDDVNITIRAGEVRGLIGSNGAGKSTFINAVSGRLPDVVCGSVTFNSHQIAGRSARSIARLGLARTFQTSSVFPDFTVRENFWLAIRSRQGVLSNLCDFGLSSSIDAEVGELVRDMKLDAHRDVRVSELSHGDQRLVEIGLAFAMRPKLLLLDEPTAGLSPAETGLVLELLRLRQHATALLIVEHDMAVVLGLSDRITVLDRGRVLDEGTPQHITSSKAVRDAYLGAYA